MVAIDPFIISSVVSGFSGRRSRAQAFQKYGGRMRLESAQGLKQQLLQDIIVPFTSAEAFAVGARPLDTVPQVHRSLAIGLAPHNGEFRIAIRLQRPSLVDSPIVERLTREASGEIDVRLIGRIDKRAKRGRVSS